MPPAAHTNEIGKLWERKYNSAALVTISPDDPYQANKEAIGNWLGDKSIYDLVDDPAMETTSPLYYLNPDAGAYFIGAYVLTLAQSTEVNECMVDEKIIHFFTFIGDTQFKQIECLLSSSQFFALSRTVRNFCETLICSDHYTNTDLKLIADAYSHLAELELARITSLRTNGVENMDDLVE